MRIRVIDLANNYYKDNEAENQSEQISNDYRPELGEYCCLGYFDALGVKLITCSNNKNLNIRKKINQVVMESLDGKCNRKHIVCITDNDNGDKMFWQYAQKMPFLFVSLIRLKYSNTKQDNLQDIVTNLNNKEGVMAYYTYDHSDIVVFQYGQQYLKDLQSVLSLYREINVFKMYSVFAVKETALEDCQTIINENVNCRLIATVKDMKNAKIYISKLQDSLFPDDSLSTDKIKCFDTLGNSDLLIEISQVPIQRLLRCYQMNQLLTHTNSDYNNAFFNIESQIFSIESWTFDSSTYNDDL